MPSNKRDTSPKRPEHEEKVDAALLILFGEMPEECEIVFVTGEDLQKKDHEVFCYWSHVDNVCRAPEDRLPKVPAHLLQHEKVCYKKLFGDVLPYADSSADSDDEAERPAAADLVEATWLKQGYRNTVFECEPFRFEQPCVVYTISIFN